MTKQNVPLRVYSKWMWLALITTFLSYIIVLSRIAETDKIAAFFTFIAVANALILGYRATKEGMTYLNSIGVK